MSWVITHASFWAKSNNAIIITFDEGDDSKGCCDAVPGAGQVATVVVTSHGPRAVTDNLPANHYSTLSSIEHAFGLGCLQSACDTKNVMPLSDLLAVTGSPAIATKVLPEQTWPTPTPSQPKEPLSFTKAAPPSGGWTVRQAQLLGANDNSLGAIAGSSPTDVWAVGNYLPDAANSNQDATLTFAEHYDGKTWTVVRTPNAGPNFNSFYGLAAAGGEAWAVGMRLNSAFADRALIEVWNGHQWSIADTPQPGSERDLLFGASALSKSNVWAVGEQEGENGIFETLAEHYDGTKWTVTRTPNPGTSGNHLSAVLAVSWNNVWAVGQRLDGTSPDQALVEHWNGARWSVVSLPASVSQNVLLDGVTATSEGQVYVVGEADSPAGGGRPLIEHFAVGHGWHVEHLPAVPGGADWSNLYGVAIAGGSVWAAGTYVDPVTDNNNALVLRQTGGSWAIVGAPNPGSGSNLPGGLTVLKGQLWLAGVYDNGDSRLPFIASR